LAARNGGSAYSCFFLGGSIVKWRKMQSDQFRHSGAVDDEKHGLTLRLPGFLLAVQRTFVLPSMFAAALLATPEVYAFSAEQAVHLVARSSMTATHAGLASVTEEELGLVWARGFSERLFAGKSMYLANGNAIEVSGNTATLLNLPPGFAGNRAAFLDIRFNPADLSTVIAKSGAALVRLSTYIGSASIDNVRADGARGPRIGSLSAHRIDLRGTTLRIERLR